MLQDIYTAPYSEERALFSQVDRLLQQADWPFALQDFTNLLPFNAYWKSSRGHYLGHNRFAYQDMLSKHFIGETETVIGSRDKDLFDGKTAKSFQYNDAKILSSGSMQPVTVIEQANLKNGQSVDQLSIKRPLCNQQGDVLGIIGFTLPPGTTLVDGAVVDPNSHRIAVNHLNQCLVTLMADAACQQLQQITRLLRVLQGSLSHFDLSLLTLRELQCFCLLGKRLSAKEIGALLRISHRTAEIFIQRLKQKLGLSFKSELSHCFWQMVNGLQGSDSDILLS